MSADPKQRSLATRSDFVAAVHEVLELAWAQRARRMLWVDTDFVDWPLGDAALLSRLVDWLRLPQRQLLLLASSYEELRRRHARFTALYASWSHAMVARAPAQEEDAPLPCLLLAERTAAAQLLDRVHWRGWIGTDPASLRLWQERADALLQRSQAAFPVTTLGL
jgi:hypothetical protein